MTDHPLLDFEAAAAARDAGTARVLENAGAAWRDLALAAVHELARTRPDLTSDDVRAAVTERPHHHNAWGSIMLTAAREGWVRRTDRTRPSGRVEAHAHSNPVWQSLIYRGAP